MSAVHAEPLQPNLLPAIESALGPLKSRDWLLAATAAAYGRAASWGITLNEVLTGGALSLCLAGTDNSGNRVVLKVPSSPAAGRLEIAALRIWDGLDCPAVLAADMTGAAFLMDFLPGSGAAIRAGDVFDLARSLHSRAVPAAPGFPSLAENVAMRLGWAEERFSRPGFEHHLPDLQSARRITGQLLDTAPQPVLLHGDFQRKNLIPTASGLKTMDPHPCTGDPLFDSAFWLALVDHDEPLEEILQRFPARNEKESGRFLAWVWALSVIENRPLTDRGARERSEFIDVFRGQAAKASERLEGVCVR